MNFVINTSAGSTQPSWWYRPYTTIAMPPTQASPLETIKRSFGPVLLKIMPTSAIPTISLMAEIRLTSYSCLKLLKVYYIM